MSQPREIESVLDRWFSDGPRELSDRALGAAFSEIDHTRQLGAHVVPWRFSEMPTPMRLLLVAALMAASAGAAFILAGGANPDVPPSSPGPPSPGPSVASSGPPEPIGGSFAGDWTAERPAVFGLEAGEYNIRIPEPASFLFAGRPGEADFILGSISTIVPYEVTDLGPTDRCPNVGRYSHELSADTSRFTITVDDDPCVDRATLLAGDWVRTWIDRQVIPGTAYSVAVAGATVDLTVPTGFRSSVGDMTMYAGPQPPSGFSKFGTGELAFLLTSGFDEASAAVDRCREAKGRQELPPTIDAYLEWSRGSTGLEVTNELRTTVGGLPAIQVDLVGGPECEPTVADLIPPTGLIRDVHQREWAIDLGGRLLLATFTDDLDPQEPLSDEALAMSQAFIDSMEITPLP
jgi:hypothetical protein